MPNSKCEKCSLYIDDIVKSKNEKITFVKLLHKRIKKIFGIPFKISPGIRHNEICGSKCNCDGVLYYEPLTEKVEYSSNSVPMSSSILSLFTKVISTAAPLE